MTGLRNFGRTWVHVVAVIALVAGVVHVPGVAGSVPLPEAGPTEAGPTEAGPTEAGLSAIVELGLTKTAVPTTVAPGETVEYRLVATCSSLELDCYGFTITDTLPAELEVTALPSSNPTRNVVFDPDTRELTITYLIDLGEGQVGVPAGSVQEVAVAMRLPTDTPVLDGTVIPNEAQVTSDAATPVTDDAEVVASIPVIIQPVATKVWEPSSVLSGSGAVTSITVGARSASTTSTPLAELVVADTTAATFDHVDLATFGVLDRFPDGADQVVVEVCTLPVGEPCGDDDWLASAPQSGPTPLTLVGPGGVDPADVTGIRFRYTNSAGGLLPRDPTTANVTFDVVLRDTLRSTGAPINPTANITIDNCAVPSGTTAGAGPGDPGDTATGTPACVPFTIRPGSVQVAATKTMFADNNGNYSPSGAIVVGQDSGISMRIEGTNNSVFPVPFLRITEPAPATATSFDKIDIDTMRITFPAGATAALVEVTCRSGANPDPVTLVPPPTTVSPPVGCADGVAPETITVTFTGEADGTPLIAAGATARLELHGRATGVTDGDVGPAGLSNCAGVTASSNPDGTGASTAADCAITPVEAPRPELGQGTKSTQGVTTITPGQELDFTLSFRNTGNIPLSDVVLVDPVDPTAPNNPFDVVRLTDLRSLVASPTRELEVWDPTAGAGGAYVPYNASNAALLERARGIRVRLTGDLAAGQLYRIGYSVLVRDDQPIGDDAVPFRNCAAVGNGLVSTSPFCSPFITAEPGGFGASINKAIVPSQRLRPQPGLPDQIASVRHQLANTGTNYLSELSFTDTDTDFFDAVEFAGNMRVNFPPGANRVRVDVCTSVVDCEAGTFVTGTPTSSQSPGLPAGVTAAQVRGVRFTFTNSNGGFEILPVTNFPAGGLCPSATVCFDVKVRPYPRPGADDPDTIVLTNTSVGAGRSVLQPVGETFAIGPAEATLTLTEGTPSLGVTKGPNSQIGPGDFAPLGLVVANTGTDAVINPVVVDPLPSGLTLSDEVPGAPEGQPYTLTYSLPAGYPQPPTVVFEAQPGDPDDPPVPGCTDPERTCAVSWSFPGWDLPPGGVVTIGLQVSLTPGVLAGDVITNTAGASGDNDNLACSTTTSVTDDPLYGPGLFCTNSAQVTTLAGDEFRAVKWVAGDPELGWLNGKGQPVEVGAAGCPKTIVGGVTYTRFPCKARVPAGQTIDYLITGINIGTDPVSQLVLVDGLPAPGDTGVLLTGQSRGTQWSSRPTLVSPVVNTDGYDGVVTTYTDATFPGAGFCTANLLPPPADTCPPDAFGPDADAAATGFRTVVDFPADALLPPGGTISFTWQMQAPASLVSVVDNPVAWNSFAFRPAFELPDGSTRYLPATETVKVGVAMPMGTFTVTKEVVGLPDGVPTGDFVFAWACEVDMADGTVQPARSGTFELAAGATFTSPLIAADATCRVWETDSRGGESDMLGEDNAVVVAVTADGPVPAIEAINTFAEGSLTLTKEVLWDAEPPVDLPGGFVFSVSCAFPGPDDVLPGYPTDVPVADGAEATIDGLPAGAVCEVTETQTQGATSVTMTPSNAPAVDDTTVAVDIDPIDDGGTTIDVLNRFATGGIELTKELTGDGAQWAQGPFTFEVVCDDPDGPLSLERTVTLTPPDLVAVVAPIPAADVCTITETDAGDGDPVGIVPDVVTIPTPDPGGPPSEPVAVVATNDFPAGAVRVVKQLDGDAATPMAAATFAVSLTCERDLVGGGVEEILALEARIGIDGELVSDVPLPVGARCWAGETDAVGAGSVTITADVDSPVAVAADNTDTITVTNTFEAGGNGGDDPGESGIEVTKVLEGPAVQWARGPFVFEVRCTLGGFTLPTYELVLDVDEPTGFVNPVPVGAECEVVEVDGGTADAEVPAVVAAVVVPAADAPPVQVVATNTFTGGSVVVAKEVVGPVAGQVAAARFTVAVTCTWDDPTTGEPVVVLDTAVEVAAGVPVTAGEALPVGSRCFGTETDDAGAAQSTVAPGNPDEAVAIGGPGDVVVVTATNQFDAATVEVAKEVVGDGPGGVFTLVVACALTTPSGTVVPVDLSGADGTIDVGGGAVAVAVDAGGVASLQVPRGAECSVTEPDNRGATATVIDEPVIVDGVARLTVTNAYPPAPDPTPPGPPPGPTPGPTPGPSPGPAPTPNPAPGPTPPIPNHGGGSLPVTGWGASNLALWGLVLAGVGVAAWATSRRRQRT